jgi:hypothetical protein
MTADDRFCEVVAITCRNVRTVEVNGRLRHAYLLSVRSAMV